MCSGRFFHMLYVLTCFFIIALPPITAHGGNAPIRIEADRMTSTEKSRSVVFSGNVDVKQGDIRIRSDKMTVHYTTDNTKDKKGAKNADQQVKKLICTGNVEITRGEWLGTAKKMIYLAKLRQVILTRNAKAWQGQNMVSGEKIIYYLDEGRSEVVGSTSVDVGKTATGKKPKRVNMTIMQN